MAESTYIPLTLRYRNKNKQIELYARGLALADGTVGHSGCLCYGMSYEAAAVLQKIADYFKGGGVWYSSYPNRIFIQLSKKGLWKTDIVGLDNIHALRGYIEGDGCWTRTGRGKYRNKAGLIYDIYYPKLEILSKEFDIVNDWLEDCLKFHKVPYSKRVWLPNHGSRKVTCRMRCLLIKGKNCIRLHDILYRNSIIHFKKYSLKEREVIIG